MSLLQRHVSLVIWVLMNFQIKGLDFSKGQVDRLGKMFYSPRVSLCPGAQMVRKKKHFAPKPNGPLDTEASILASIEFCKVCLKVVWYPFNTWVRRGILWAKCLAKDHNIMNCSDRKKKNAVTSWPSALNCSATTSPMGVNDHNSNLYTNLDLLLGGRVGCSD